MEMRDRDVVMCRDWVGVVSWAAGLEGEGVAGGQASCPASRFSALKVKMATGSVCECRTATVLELVPNGLDRHINLMKMASQKQ